MADSLPWELQNELCYGICGKRRTPCHYTHSLLTSCRFSLGQRVLELSNDQHLEVTILRPSPDKVHMAVGYSDGTVDIYDQTTRKSVAKFAIHRTAINCLQYDDNGMRILTGGLDTDIALLDVVAQVGVSKLTGHRGPVTDLMFLGHLPGDLAVSCSKDTQIKFWDLSTMCCFKTLVDIQTEVWTMCMIREKFLVTGSTTSTLNVYSLTENHDQQPRPAHLVDDEEAAVEFETDLLSPINCKLVGTIERTGKGRTARLLTDQNGTILACHGVDDKIELFYFRSEAESVKKLTKRMKKLTTTGKSAEDEEAVAAIAKTVTLADEVRRLDTFSVGGKIKSMDCLAGQNNGELRMAVTTADNSIRLFSRNLVQKSAETVALRSLAKLGHGSDVRAVTFSSDNQLIASGSAETLHIWNQESMACIRTMDTGYVLTCQFAPGDRYLLMGYKTGELVIADVVTGEILETIPAHEKELWDICLTSDFKGCVSGGGDATVKFWTFALVDEQEKAKSSKKKKDKDNVGATKRVLSLTHRNTLKLDETVLGVRLSGNGKFLAAALLDSTVKLFFVDSLKFYLNLYGHKLPVTCMSISEDSTLIATGSADRNIKIWGMDFGDCHRSIFAHEDSVMGLQFVPRTHLLFSCGKDGQVKQWDADNFEKIATVTRHLGEALTLAVSPSGELVVSSGTDRVLRLCEKTEEVIVLQDAQETEREEQENQQLATSEETTVATVPNLKLASKKTIGSERGAESILEALEIDKELMELDGEAEQSKKEKHPLMMVHGVDNSLDLLLAVLKNIRASDLEESLLLLPFTAVCEIIPRIYQLAETRRDQTEMVCKIVLFLFRVHQKPIVNNAVMYTDIRKMIERLRAVLVEYRDTVGRNMHALQIVRRQIEANDGVDLFRDATKKKKTKDARKKQKYNLKRRMVQQN